MRLPESSFLRWVEATENLGPAPYNVRVVAKLRTDVSMERARAEMETVYARAVQDYPSYQRKHVRLHFASLKEKLAGDARRGLIVLLVSAGFVLLIACANIANLLLARASTRRREIAIRVALGAGRLRMLRQLLTESVVLALSGGAAGLLLPRWAIAVIVRIAPQAAPRLGEATIDASVLSFTLAVSLAAGILFGLGPVISRFRMRGLLVAAELALAIVLLTGAGLMLKSFWRMNARPPGFKPEDILVMSVSFSGAQYAAWPPKAAYIRQLLQGLETAP
jgi:HAMP domain-containing protein